MKANYKKYILNFKRPSGTSRGVLTTKETWFLILEENGKIGIGECGILRTLSIDDRPDYEEKLQWTCQNIHLGEQKLWDELIEFPSIQFGLEQAFLSLKSETSFELFPSQFTKGKKSIPIKSDQMIQALNYLRPYISRGVFPELGNDKNHEMTGLYSFIADREEFDGIEGDFFNGFISLKQYHHLYEYEIYHNPEDKIKIYVYLDEFNMNTESSKYKVKPNKAYSFYIN